MADVGLRDLGAFVPGRRSEPAVTPVGEVPVLGAADAGSVIITPPPAPAKERAVFGGDLPTGADALGIDTPIAHLAELAAHRGTASPTCIGLLGGAGSGKSFALRRLTARIGALASAASTTRGPFLSRVHVQTLDAGTLDGDPALALAAQLHAGLRQPYPDLARELGHTARDPHVVARETGEKLDDARRRLDAERRTLDESGSRLARLTETVLYEAAGSQVDSYARAHRGSLENRQVAFGITGDPIRNYKDLVRVVAESGGPIGLSLRALYGFKGQTRLVVLALVFVLVGIGLGVAIDMQDSWLGAMRGGPQASVATATWMAAHIDLLALAKKAAFILAVLLVAANLWRAFNFVQPILTGVRLLRADLANRRRDLDGLYAHQTKRVDNLSADVERLARVSAEAEKRLGGSGHHGAIDAPPFDTTVRAQARTFFVTLGRMLREGSQAAPQRIVLALDHLDAVTPVRAKEILDSVHRLAAESGIVTLVAVDPRRLDTSLADLERWIQLPLRLDAKPEERDHTAIVLQALGHAPAPASAPAVDATRSALDEPVSEAEATLLAALAPVAGGSPRLVKRFVNLYTLARLDSDAQKGALALMLALDQGGTQAERQASEEAMAGPDLGASFAPAQTSARLRLALEAVAAFDGRVSKADVAKAASRATLFSVAAFV
ncbi:P-loop NTPase fold protein [Beijerinckia sp. L45]|uniref:P-loop NTPase fold protein n=1 Tax=Beijerinckia sp. L45 TaxID=1641855 RepID=UPI00131EBD65|nr:P-loop NTPase fold protein [Beijerinckia sp. L45]